MTSLLRVWCTTGVVVAVLTGCSGAPASESTLSDGVALEEFCALALDVEDVVAQADGADVVVTWRDTQAHLGATEYWVARRAPGETGWAIVGTVELEPDAERRQVDTPPEGGLPAEYTVAVEGSCVRSPADICAEGAPCPVASIDPPAIKP
ncbi:hypothetical protein [Pengzhenrongella frigida]|uniref:Lipoprotein n=1 Tax=Pengzhenrongella frigida TaxID=1259133 RepID=A0A4Q5N1P5_9MICO|nr:hypothetical protein [Cellulomonas sp. HLT2-17]RYV52048.1 hypothetical protein EUA98_05640 [Cellulomonas sp. HLT2-17]